MADNGSTRDAVTQALVRSGFWKVQTMAPVASQGTTAGDQFYNQLCRSFGTEENPVLVQDPDEVLVRTAGCLTSPVHESRYCLNEDVITAICIVLSKAFCGMTLPFKRTREQASATTRPPAFCIFGTHYWQHFTLPSFEFDAVRRWQKHVHGQLDAPEGEPYIPNFMECSMLFFPVHTPAHWKLVTVDMSRHRIVATDSCLGSSGPKPAEEAAESVLHWVQTQWTMFYSENPCPEFTIIVDDTAPQQTNGNDCGIFMLCNIMAQIEGYENCGEIDPPRVRAWLLEELYIEGVRTASCTPHSDTLLTAERMAASIFAPARQDEDSRVSSSCDALYDPDETQATDSQVAAFYGTR